MVFCNLENGYAVHGNSIVTILILIDGFLQQKIKDVTDKMKAVTILILIDGFLQQPQKKIKLLHDTSHNPYFNRWFSAIWLGDGTQAEGIMSQSLF